MYTEVIFHCLDSLFQGLGKGTQNIIRGHSPFLFAKKVLTNYSCSGNKPMSILSRQTYLNRIPKPLQKKLKESVNEEGLYNPNMF